VTGFIRSWRCRSAPFAPRRGARTRRASSGSGSSSDGPSSSHGRTPLVLTERRDHLEILAGTIRRASPGCIVLHGGLSARERKQALRLAATPDDGRERVVLAIGKYVGEGFDDSRLDTLFLAMPVAWRGTLAQYAGRLHRRGDGKDEIRVHDYVDAGVPALARMAARRHASMRALGYAEEDAAPRPTPSTVVVDTLEPLIAAED
jgi:superfamily II DNA or RNA helicase